MASLTNWRGISPEHTLSRYRDHFFDGSFRRAWENSRGLESDEFSIPAINVKEDEDAYVIELAAPGYEKSDFSISVQGRTLNIRAEKGSNGQPIPEPSGETQASNRYTRREFYYQTFSRSFTLPDNAQEEQISAHYENGILFIEVPVDGTVQTPAQSRRINVS